MKTLLLPLLCALLAGDLHRADAADASATNAPAFIARGRVIDMLKTPPGNTNAPPPGAKGPLWGFKTADGKTYLLQRGKFSEAIWLDDRIRARELELNLRLSPASPAAEVLALRSVKDGVVQDLYYYCNVCIIKSVSPEPCYCCQAPVELIEKPWRGRPEE